MRFFRTPKGLLTIVLVVLAGVSAPAEGVRQVWPGLVAAAAAAMAADVHSVASDDSAAAGAAPTAVRRQKRKAKEELVLSPEEQAAAAELDGYLTRAAHLVKLGDALGLQQMIRPEIAASGKYPRETWLSQ